MWRPALAMFLLIGVLGQGATLRVPQDYPTVQAAVDAAYPGDVIVIAAGTYPEDLEIEKSVILRGSGEVRLGSEGVLGMMVRHGEIHIQDLTLAGGLQVMGDAHVILARCALERAWLSDNATLELENCTGGAGTGFGLAAMGPTTITARRSQLAGIILSVDAHALLGECRVTGNAQLVQSSLTAYNCEFAGSLELVFSSIALSGCRLLGPVSLQSQAGALLESCTIEVTRIGVSLVADAEAEIHDSRFSGGQAACDVSGRAQLELTDCEITGCKGAGIRAWDNSGLKLTRVKVIDAGEYGVLAKGEVSVEAETCSFSGCGDGMRLLSGARASLVGCSFLANREYGLAAMSGAAATGSGNEFRGNGCDLIGDISPGFRTPLRAATLEEARFPSPEFAILQEAVDALLPGGRLFISEGEQTAGCVIDKPLSIVGEGAGSTLLLAPSAGVPAISVAPGGNLSLAGVGLRGGAFGLAVSGDASAQLTGVRLIGGKTGIALWQTAHISLADCEITDTEVGLELWGNSSARVRACRFFENTQAGIHLWDSASLHLEGTTVTGNGKGVVCYVRGCGFAWAPEGFAGEVTGSGNRISGNLEADLCPPYPGPPWPEGFLAER